MKDWIVLPEGKYAAVRACLTSPDRRAVLLEDAFIQVSTGRAGSRSLSGQGLVQNLLLVTMLEDQDEMDLLLDLGQGHQYRLKNPMIQAGKVFSANVKATCRFIPAGPWEPVEDSEFERIWGLLEILG